MQVNRTGSLLHAAVFICGFLYSIPCHATHGNIIDHLVHDEAYLQLFWDSRYVSEGRDNLDGQPIQTSILSLNYEHFALLVWNGWGYNAEYNELNITPTFYFSLSDLDFYVNYNRLEFTEDDLSDNELGAGVSYNGLVDNIYFDADWYHSFNAKGSFFEFSLAHVYELEAKLKLESRAVVGINENYIPDGHNGLNHFALQFTAEYSLFNNLNLHGLLAYYEAFDRQPKLYAGDELLRDFAWARIGLEFLF